MACEICGREVPPKAMSYILVDGAVLQVCPACSGFGERVAPPKPKVSIRRTASTTKPLPVKPRPEELLCIVEDYASIIVRSREASGLSRDELARAINEKESVIKSVEASRLVPSVSLARKLERMLKVNLVTVTPEAKDKSAAKQPSREEDLTLGDIVKIRKKP